MSSVDSIADQVASVVEDGASVDIPDRINSGGDSIKSVIGDIFNIDVGDLVDDLVGEVLTYLFRKKNI